MTLAGCSDDPRSRSDSRKIWSWIYNGTKAFPDSFSYALREELKNTEITVTCLMPGATETQFFRRAGRLDTKINARKKDDPGDLASDGFKAMMSGGA
jgi:short-subunit dehydrogenase